MLILSLDTATDAASCALVHDGDVLGERRSRSARILADAHELLEHAAMAPRELDGIAVGTGPGSYTGLRMGLAAVRALSLSLDLPVAGVSTLAALAAGTSDALPVIDARRGEVFTLIEGEPRVLRPEDVPVESGILCVGDGAVRYRALIERAGGEVPDDSSDVHVPWARFHAALATEFGPAELATPVYLRVPDAERALQR